MPESRFEGHVHVNVNTKSEDWKISTKWSLVWRWWLTSIFLVLRFYTFYTLVTRMIGSLRHALKTAVTGGHMAFDYDAPFPVRCAWLLHSVTTASFVKSSISLPKRRQPGTTRKYDLLWQVCNSWKEELQHFLCVERSSTMITQWWIMVTDMVTLW